MIFSDARVRGSRNRDPGACSGDGLGRVVRVSVVLVVFG